MPHADHWAGHTPPGRPAATAGATAPHALRQSPQIAIVVPNTLACLGLAGIIERMMPVADVCTFARLADLEKADEGQFVHYFISARVLMENAAYFLERQPRTIVLIHGNESGHLPQGFHTLNVYQSEEHLLHAFVRLVRMAHGAHNGHPAIQPPAAPAAGSVLTPREAEVLRLVATGKINKEIATTLGVSLTTVITHRKNLSEKLGIKSVSGLTIYAVMHGLIKAEDI